MSQVSTDVVAFEVLIAVWILYRSIRNYQGRRLVLARVVSFPVLAGLLWLAAEGSTALTIPWTFPWWTAIDVALVAVAIGVTLPLAPRLVSVYVGADREWWYRYGIELIAFYLAAWVVRLVLAVYYDPSSLEFTVSTGPALSPLASDVMQVVQMLLSISTGLVVGRAAGTYRLYNEARAKATGSGSPLP
jgi:hypothetical protein